MGVVQKPSKYKRWSLYRGGRVLTGRNVGNWFRNKQEKKRQRAGAGGNVADQPPCVGLVLSIHLALGSGGQMGVWWAGGGGGD